MITPIYYLARQVFHGLLYQFQVSFLMMRTIKAGVKTPKLKLRLKSYLKLKQLKQVKKIVRQESQADGLLGEKTILKFFCIFRGDSGIVKKSNSGLIHWAR